MLRALLLLFVAAGAWARGSDAIPVAGLPVSNRVSQPHVTAELIAETTYLKPGPFLVALHLHMDPDWHTYWINPGDAGLATTIKWTLPAGFTAGPIQWPTPEVHMMGPLTTYGYGGDVYLLTTITVPDKIGAKLPLPIKAHADWLVCQEECIPGKGDLALMLDDKAVSGSENSVREKFLAEAKARLPVPNTEWALTATYTPHLMMSDGSEGLFMTFANKPGTPMEKLGRARFFPEQSNVLSCAAADNSSPATAADKSWLGIKLQQNGEKPDHLSGVLVSDQPLQSDGVKAVYISSFPVSSAPAAPMAQEASDNHRPPLQEEGQPFLVAVLGAAFLGGLILNLMPCVLPVLSLKVFSLLRHAGENPRAAWRQGAAFTVGVVISFWILAGLLIALRAAGNHLGWGFQMQSPGFVLALIFLFFLLGLNLFGVFELGTSLVGLDAKATGRVGNGLTSSFLNGALATLAATPCTAPFMGSSVGFAAEQPPFVALLVFTVLALGMATPYLLLTIFPGALRFVPKPGAWMEAFKQFMGFLLMATVIFLVYVFGALVGQDQVPDLLAVLLLAGIAAWIYGRWGAPGHRAKVRGIAVVLALAFLFCAVNWGVLLARATPAKTSLAATDGWQPWSAGAVDQTLAQNRPVFVDFTAAWCLSCKVNESVALGTDSVRLAFAQKHVALFRADWTHSDPAISAVLEKYHRDGVPLYLLYSPAAKGSPQILPEVLTPELVVDAVRALP